MIEQQKHRRRLQRRSLALVAIAVVAVIGGGVASYAATNGWRTWTWSLSIDQQGTVVDDDGNIIGQSTDNMDGTSTTVVKMGDGYIELHANESLKGKDLRVDVESAE